MSLVQATIIATTITVTITLPPGTTTSNSNNSSRHTAVLQLQQSAGSSLVLPLPDRRKVLAGRRHLPPVDTRQNLTGRYYKIFVWCLAILFTLYK